MLKTTAMILDELKSYASPSDKLTRLVQKGEYFPVTKGLYETEQSTPGYLLAGSIYGPSYLSFEYALAYYGLIPEAVYTFTSATFEKRKKKTYENSFGTFTYMDVPSSAYATGIQLLKEGKYAYAIATKEKALCDQLYKIGPVSNNAELRALLFEDLRIDAQDLAELDLKKLKEIADRYPCRNVRKFYMLMQKMWK